MDSDWWEETQIEKLLGGTQDRQEETRCDDMKTAENYATNFDWTAQRGPTPIAKL